MEAKRNSRSQRSRSKKGMSHNASRRKKEEEGGDFEMVEMKAVKKMEDISEKIEKAQFETNMLEAARKKLAQDLQKKATEIHKNAGKPKSSMFSNFVSKVGKLVQTTKKPAPSTDTGVEMVERPITPPIDNTARQIYLRRGDVEGFGSDSEYRGRRVPTSPKWLKHEPNPESLLTEEGREQAERETKRFESGPLYHLQNVKRRNPHRRYLGEGEDDDDVFE